MQMIADLHTHTLCATHAYNTFTEMAAAAKEIGYCALAVTDHAPAMPDSPQRRAGPFGKPAQSAGLGRRIHP